MDDEPIENCLEHVYVRKDLYFKINDAIMQVDPEIAIDVLCTFLAQFASAQEYPEEIFQKMFHLVKKIMNMTKWVRERKNDN